MDERIIKFIKKHHVLTLATSGDNLPYCASCFYAYNKDNNQIVFTSDVKTKHMQDALKQPVVAGTIALETKIIGKIQGIQFRGILSEAVEKKQRQTYLKRFPFAILADTKLWIIQLTYIKFTDNRLGFGKKLIWGEL
ncbi:MAG: pyridoxamine 5'-phosphate oxidase family protein [Bacteroidales bacterium]|nr:pyridoxamine 5'-phosphate oxidase family protein [Bacteroidales bacterium]